MKYGNQSTESKKNRRQIIDFIADSRISDSKSISKAIGLKPSKTRDYLKQLVDEGILETEGEYKNWKYRIKKLMFDMDGNVVPKDRRKCILGGQT